ncbi:unnamed protein product [Cyprideis torosa]|uniref:Uncharacterized protein n=1 Tax=Cyprideis torosa TaxID=163714 RepID=A0A7R8ZWA1_9CRUS|nr:unnamed protein product [Cyprideis torosa]CAG0904509.1 unnamed protein product [Cyprideis torosa]
MFNGILSLTEKARTAYGKNILQQQGYTERAMPAGPDQSSNPEVSINALVAVNSDVNDQIVALKMISQNLKSAYNGISVNWREYAEWQSRHASSPPRGHVPSPPLPPTRPAEEAQGQIQMTAPQVEVEEGSG